MKLDPAALRYLSDDDFRVLTAVEMGMRNHELVPVPLISAISGLRHGGYMRALKQIHKNKLVHKESTRYVGYRLTTLGYDYLAMRALVRRGVISAVGRPLGVGKEADVFIVTPSDRLLEDCPELGDEQPMLAMKLHRLGRTSFRAVKSKRDYLVHRKSASWIYFSRLAAIKEYAFMSALHVRGFPVPRPLGHSRHVVIMELCPGKLLSQVHELPDPTEAANELLQVAVRFAQHGLIHCDLNEFNVICDEDGKLRVIDFPQMVSTSHQQAEQLFQRDVDGIHHFFQHRFNVPEDDMICPDFDEIISQRDGLDQIDTLVSASGFRNTEDEEQLSSDNPIVDVNSSTNDAEEMPGLDLTSLQISLDDNEVRQSDNDSESVDEVNQGNSRSIGKEEREEVEEDAHLNFSAIEARVRRQRNNQKQRRQLSRRNVVKDSEKRKVKVEMNSAFWG